MDDIYDVIVYSLTVSHIVTCLNVTRIRLSDMTLLKALLV